ncbi:MAG TPA: M23 family metallopeptidase [Sphingomonadales bacterium]|nr:M23 family metallopeptidase [Sphingomonadales bacterium]
MKIIAFIYALVSNAAYKNIKAGFVNKRMRTISNFFMKLRETIMQRFPERQLYFRTNGVVRFVSISHRTQLIAIFALFGVFVWTALTSYSYVFRAEILAAKDVELAKAEKNYTKANEQFDNLKKDIQKSTMALEQRQIYLQQLLEADKSLSSTMLPDQKQSQIKNTLPQKNNAEPDVISYNAESSDVIGVYQNHKAQLANFEFSIARIEQQQQALAEKMISRISRKIEYVENTLKKSGIKSSKLIQLSRNRPSLSMAMGGPFILYSENNDIDLSSNEPFAKLYAHHNRLIDLESAMQHIPVGKPAKKYYISSSFGIRKDPFKKKWARHHGIDMAGWWKTPIYASANGTIIKAGRNGAYGNFIEIDHGNGFRSRYGHLSKILVKKGDKVTLEQKIGLMGSTGRSTSPHLHYEIWFNGKPINPQKIFKASNNVLKIQRQEYDS